MASIQTYRDYIDMEKTSSSSSSDFFCNYSINCSPMRKTREFEFQMDLKNPSESEPTTLSADELFYKGKILPLQSNLMKKENSVTTQLESCNNIISPSKSRKQSQDDQYFFEWSSIEFDEDFIGEGPESRKNSWTKTVNKVKKFSLITQKLKASRQYIKLLFNKSRCSNDTCATPQLEKISSKRKFSKRSSSSSSSISSSGSSSFSLSSSSSSDIQSFRRRIGLNSENEISIEGAIDHCKQSRLITRTCSSSAASRFSTFGDHQRPELCYIY